MTATGVINADVVVEVNGETGDVDLNAADVGADATGTATAAVAAHTGASDPHGDRAYADAEIGALTAADVGADPSGTAASVVAAHVAALDPHGDRAFAVSYTDAALVTKLDQVADYLDITTVPTSGSWTVGDIVMTRLGLARCITSGTPGTWRLLGNFPEIEEGFCGWSFRPGSSVQGGTIIPTGGTSHIVRFRAMQPTISAVDLHATVSAAGVTNAHCTIHNDAGALIGADAKSNANMNVEFQTGGYKTFTLITPQAVTPGAYYRVRFWFTTTTALPTLSRATNSSSEIINPRQPTIASPASTPFNWARADAGLTDLASAPDQIGNCTGHLTAYWVGIRP